MSRAGWVLPVLFAMAEGFFAEVSAYEKIKLQYAKRFTVEYRDNLTLVAVNEPWRGSKEVFKYTFVRRGEALPAGVNEKDVIRTPVRKAVTMSTTTLPMIDLLGKVDVLVGVSEFDFVNTESVRQLIVARKIKEVGGASNLNIELLYALDPDIIFTYAYGLAGYDSHPILAAAGIRHVLMACYMEDTLLGRAEGIKFVAILLGVEEKANREFAIMAAKYEETKAKIGVVQRRPTVFCNSFYNGVWAMSSGRSMFANAMRDAGGDYLWADSKVSGALDLDFEAVFNKAAHAEVWLLDKSPIHSLGDLQGQDERYAMFDAFNKGSVFNCNRRLNATGGNDFFELGMIKPHLILADLVKIFHPALMKDYEFCFYKPLGAK